ncbi:hypothetical protein Pcinc_003759 [Petrolisthes cinctipes]|uniref:3'-5' exonuclease domain-containing protein n=1 Tax=Petrolisthes cinctipes TaxID=88211 RepID=A0AAE1L0Z4_PETCI|nr:hypothetical protein Pcinc_003759 [Petrolisthes cinctipes]
MVRWGRMVIGAVVVAATGGGVVGSLLLYRYLRQHTTIAHKLLAWRTRRIVKRALKRIHVVEDEETWEKVLPLLISESRREGAVGVDCEWTNTHSQRKPVALLQLATCSGLCVIIRLSHMQSNIPPSLKSLLEDDTILKVGIATLDDSTLLHTDYCIKVHGCVDLRHLAVQIKEGPEKHQHQHSQEGDRKALGLGLNALSTRHLGLKLDKDIRIRTSNWDADTLTNRQLCGGTFPWSDKHGGDWSPQQSCPLLGHQNRLQNTPGLCHQSRQEMLVSLQRHYYHKGGCPVQNHAHHSIHISAHSRDLGLLVERLLSVKDLELLNMRLLDVKLPDLELLDVRLPDLGLLELRLLDLRLPDLRLPDLGLLELRLPDLGLLELRLLDLRLPDLGLLELRLLDLRLLDLGLLELETAGPETAGCEGPETVVFLVVPPNRAISSATQKE